LKLVDDRLNLVWQPALGQWAVVEHWRPNDPRRELVQKGEIEADYDLFMSLSANIDPETMIDHIREKLLASDMTKRENQSRIKRIQQMQYHNKDVGKKALEAAQEPVLAEVEYQAKRIIRDPGAIGREEGIHYGKS
jgi:hypothetical protein